MKVLIAQPDANPITAETERLYVEKADGAVLVITPYKDGWYINLYDDAQKLVIDPVSRQAITIQNRPLGA